MKIRPVGDELFHADGQTDTTKLTVASRNSANIPKNAIHLLRAQIKKKIQSADHLYCGTVHFGDNLLHTNECTVIL